jgi:hypothetical protein
MPLFAVFFRIDTRLQIRHRGFNSHQRLFFLLLRAIDRTYAAQLALGAAVPPAFSAETLASPASNAIITFLKSPT